MAITRVHFYSSALGTCQTVDVILPQRKDGKRGVKLPVLWLLHGMYGNHYDWIRRTAIERYVAPYGLAVVMPSAQNSRYVNMVHGGKYFDYITKELPEKMRSMFNFSDKREDNFIAGLSMGGAGCLLLGTATPKKYSAIGCLSAGSSAIMQKYSDNPINVWCYGDKILENTNLDPIYNAKQILKKGLPCPRIYHACGKDDTLVPYARETADYFNNVPGNPFDYVYEEDEGAHTWIYWDEHIKRFIEYLKLPVTTEYC